MTRGEVVLAGIVSACITILLTTISVHCQIVGERTDRECLTQGNDPLACRELSP